MTNIKGFYYNLNGGINTSRTRIGLGQDSKKLYWWDSYNVEIYKNQGISRIKGNQIVLKTDEECQILGLYEYPKNTNSFVFVTSNNEVYHYDSVTENSTLVKTFEKDVSKVSFVHYLDGIVIATNSNPGIFYNINSDEPLHNLDLQDSNDEPISSEVVAVYANRLWVAKGSTIYFSALGRYDDWTSPADAGYIAKFHSSSSEILSMCCYPIPNNFHSQDKSVHCHPSLL